MLTAIAAVDQNWNIGRDGQLLISIPDDMRFFRQATKGRTVIMGRKTLESFPGGKPLKGRVNIVLSRSMACGETQIDETTKLIVLPGVDELQSYIEAHRSGRSARLCADDDIFVIGGGQIYRRLLPMCGRALITYVRHSFEGADTSFPDLDADPAWNCVQERGVQEYDGLRFSFRTYINASSLW